MRRFSPRKNFAKGNLTLIRSGVGQTIWPRNIACSENIGIGGSHRVIDRYPGPIMHNPGGLQPQIRVRLLAACHKNLVNQKCVLGLGPVAYCSAAHTFKRNRRQIQLIPTKSNGIHDDIAAYNYMTAARSTQD